MTAQQIDNLQEKMNWHWRNTMRTARFFAFDARAALPFLLLFVYARWSTLFLTIATLVLFRYLERKGLTFPAALRNLRAWFTGEERPGWLSSEHKKFQDLE